ncbi:MAG TPA: methyltransferase domain-containing protein [Salinarimonas sp.]|nr:methyltransferase domain-containing protein [Salinarimonas sp.]
MLLRTLLPRRPLLAAAILSAGLAQAAFSQAALAQAPSLDVPYVPTPESVVDRMLELADVKATDYVVDLGSGDGRMPIRAAQKYGARGLGVDLNPQRVQEANENAKTAGVTDKVEFRVGDLYETPLDERVNVMTMYLLTRVNADLRPRILNGLKPGTRVVSHAFNMGDWTPDRAEKVDGRDVYFWIVPAKVDGRWQMKAGNDEILLDMTQQFQKVQGVARLNGRYHTLQSVTLRGDEISFAIEPREGPARRFTGRVGPGGIEGTQTDGAAWSARRAAAS